MPVTNYICKICNRRIKVNYLEKGGTIETPCTAEHKIAVTTDDDGRINKIEEIKAKKKPYNWFSLFGKIALILSLYYLIVPGDVRDFILWTIGQVFLYISDWLSYLLGKMSS